MLHFLAIGVSVVVLLFAIIATATTRWIVIWPTGRDPIAIGLWIINEIKAADWPDTDVKRSMGAAEAFALLCIFVSAGALGSAAAAFATKKRVLWLAGAGLSGASFLFSLISWAVFIDRWRLRVEETCNGRTKTDQCGFNFGLGLMVASSILAIVAAVLMFLTYQKTADEGSSSGADNNKSKEAPATQATPAPQPGTSKPDNAASNPLATKQQTTTEDSKPAAAAAKPAATTTTTTEVKQDPVKAIAAPSAKSERWKGCKDRLPRLKNPEQKEKRKALFQQFDVDKNKKLTYEDIRNGALNILKMGDFVDEPMPIIERAYVVAGGKGGNIGDGNTIEFLEFRLFLCYVYDYVELDVMFDEIDSSDDRMVSFKELQDALPMIAKWGLKIDDAKKAMADIDKDGSGSVTFNEFAEWAISMKLDADGERNQE